MLLYIYTYAYSYGARELCFPEKTLAELHETFFIYLFMFRACAPDDRLGCQEAKNIVNAPDMDWLGNCWTIHGQAIPLPILSNRISRAIDGPPYHVGCCQLFKKILLKDQRS